MERERFEDEEFKVINGYENYEVSNYGRVWSIRRKKFLSPSTLNGYKMVCLRKDKKNNSLYIHRLVLETFNPTTDRNRNEVNHKDENRGNNRLDNLEWMSHKENLNYGTHNQRVTESKIKSGKFNPAHIGMDKKEQMKRWQIEHYEHYIEYQREYDRTRRSRKSKKSATAEYVRQYLKNKNRIEN